LTYTIIVTFHKYHWQKLLEKSIGKKTLKNNAVNKSEQLGQVSISNVVHVLILRT